MAKSRKDHPDYRPETYWKHGDAEASVIARIRNADEQRRILDAWKSGQSTDENSEFLGAVTIVRFLLESVHGDVIDLVAIPLPDGRIRLRWQDDYESDFNQPYDIAGGPLSQAETIDFIERSNQGENFPLPLCYNAMNFENDTEMTEDQLREFTKIKSRFYPGLQTWFERKLEEWIATLDFSDR